MNQTMTLEQKNNLIYRILTIICVIIPILCFVCLFIGNDAIEYPTGKPTRTANTSLVSDLDLPLGGVAGILAHDKNYESYLEESLNVISEYAANNTSAERWIDKHIKKVGKACLNARTYPNSESDNNIYCILAPHQEVIVIGNYGKNWYMIEHDKRILYVKSEFIADIDYGDYDGSILSPAKGKINGPNGSETWYNLDMTRVVIELENKGYTGEYSVREDGCKMFGDYIMVAANYDIHPYGSIVETSLGLGIVCDTGGYVKWNPTGFDIATNW